MFARMYEKNILRKKVSKLIKYKKKEDSLNCEEEVY